MEERADELSDLARFVLQTPGTLYGDVPMVWDTSSDALTVNSLITTNDLVLHGSHPDRETMRFCEDGRIYIRGELVDDNTVVYQALRGFLMGRNPATFPRATFTDSAVALAGAVLAGNLEAARMLADEVFEYCGAKP